MSVRDGVREQLRAEGRGSWALWLGTLGGPVAWGAAFLFNYPLEEVLACSPAVRTKGEILGLGTEAIMWVANGAATLLALICLGLAIHCLRVTSRTDTSTGNRAGWMAKVGVLTSALFLILIVAQFGPMMFLDRCEVAP